MKASAWILGLLACIAAVIVVLWLALPSVATRLMVHWLERQGYDDVVVRIDRPGLHSMSVPHVSLSRRLAGEVATLSLTDFRAQYRLSRLWEGHLDLIELPDLSVEITTVREAPQEAEPSTQRRGFAGKTVQADKVTASDLLQELPVLPCDEVRLGRVRIYREQATGPLQTVQISGTVKQLSGQLAVELLLQGAETNPYELRLTGQSVSDLSFQLRAAQADAQPIILWQSESVSGEAHVQIKGVMEVNVRELAPFLALALPIGSEWQQAAGTVKVQWTGTAASDVPLESLWRDAGTEVEADVNVAATLPALDGVAQDLTVNVTGNVSGNPTAVHWVISPGVLATAKVNVRKVAFLKPLHDLVPSGIQPVAVASVQETKGELHWFESPPRVVVTGPVSLSYGSGTEPTYVELVATQLSGLGQELERLMGSFHIKGALSAALSGSIGVQEGSGDVRGTLEFTGQMLQATVLPHSASAFRKFQQDPLMIDRGTMQLAGPLPLQFDIATGRWAAGPGLFTVGMKQVQVGDRPVTVGKASVALEKVEGDEAGWKAKATAKLAAATVKHSTGQTLPMDLTVRVTADPDVVTADVLAQSQQQAVKLSAKLEHAWATGRGTVRGALAPLVFERTGFRLRQVLSPWSYPFDVTDGKVVATFHAAWAEDARQQIQIQNGAADVSVEKLAAQYRDISLAGLSTTLKVMAKGQEMIATARPAEITVASIESGVAVTNLAMTVQGEWDLRERLPIVEVRDLTMDLLGGKVTSERVRADLAHPPLSMTLLVRQLDLQKVLSLEQQKGLQGTGLLDGSIPLTLSSRGLRVKDGTFVARPPGGVIRYDASPEAAKTVTDANSNMTLVLQALSNFHYSMLQVDAQYVEDGTLNLRAQIEGRNPDQKKSPPIHFNLTVQENIPALLKSLRLVQDIEESVQKKFIKP
ncbi:MAG TPA: YdbH domain-containing protein [Nitrospira sp.]